MNQEFLQKLLRGTSLANQKCSVVDQSFTLETSGEDVAIYDFEFNIDSDRSSNGKKFELYFVKADDNFSKNFKTTLETSGNPDGKFALTLNLRFIEIRVSNISSDRIFLDFFSKNFQTLSNLKKLILDKNSFENQNKKMKSEYEKSLKMSNEVTIIPIRL